MTKKMTDKGWLVTEDQAPPQNFPNGAARVAKAPVFDFAAECAARKVVAIDAEEYRTMTERLSELERTIDSIAKEAAEAGDPPPVAPVVTGKGKGKGKLNIEEIKAAIAVAQSLDDLTEIMSRVDDPALLALADAKAAELS